MCCLECALRHEDGQCELGSWAVPRFAEIFSGPHAPLTCAVAQAMVAVAPPYDVLRGSPDFFSPEGRSQLKAWADDEFTAAEHLAPDCSLMSRARGRPIRLQDGSWVKGPQQVRDAVWPLGFPWLTELKLIERVRRSNDMFAFALDRLQWRLVNWGFASIEHPVNSWGWLFPQAVVLKGLDGVFFTIVYHCCHGGRRYKGSGILHNCPALHVALHQEEPCPGHEWLLPFSVEKGPGEGLVFDTKEEAEYPVGLCEAYAAAMAHALDVLESRSLPAEISLRPTWVCQELSSATKRLALQGTSAAVADALCRMLAGMEPGREVQHLQNLLRFTNHRGSEVRLGLWAGIDDGMPFPYPAFAWRWKSVLSYRWVHDQHINILEFMAFFNYLRTLSNKRHLQHLRLFHVFDSKVVCGVLGKGRSPSRRINRCSRRLLPLVLGMDVYVMTLWTISAWQYSDAASRIWKNEG